MIILQRTFPFKFRLIPCMKIRLISKKTKSRISLDLQRDLHHVTYIVHRGPAGPRRHPTRSRIYIEKYLQLKYRVSIPQKNLDLLDQEPHGIVG